MKDADPLVIKWLSPADKKTLGLSKDLEVLPGPKACWGHAYCDVTNTEKFHHFKTKTTAESRVTVYLRYYVFGKNWNHAHRIQT